MPDWTIPHTWDPLDFFTAPQANTFIRDNTTYLVWKETSEMVADSDDVTDLLGGEFSIPAHKLGSHRRAVLTMTGGIKNNIGTDKDGPRFRLKYGADEIFDLDFGSTYDLTSNSAEGAWWARVELKQQAATNAQEWTVDGELVSGFDSNLTVGRGLVRQGGTGKGGFMFGRNTTTLDTTVVKQLAWTVKNAFKDANYITTLYSATLAIL